MGKERSGKLDKMIGVDDKDLKTPRHDELCLWIDKNYQKILIEKLNFNKDKDESLKHICLRNVIKKTEKEKKGITCDELINGSYPTYEFCKKLNGECIINNKGIDKKCPYYKNFEERFLKDKEKLQNITFEEFYDIDFLWEEPIKAPHNGFIIGIPDFTITLKHKCIHLDGFCYYDNGWMRPKKIFMEVKPKIVSIGETMRQLKLYHSYIDSRERNDNYIFLVTQSNNLDIFEKQGIKTFIITDEMLKGVE